MTRFSDLLPYYLVKKSLNPVTLPQFVHVSAFLLEHELNRVEFFVVKLFRRLDLQQEQKILYPTKKIFKANLFASRPEIMKCRFQTGDFQVLNEWVFFSLSISEPLKTWKSPALSSSISFYSPSTFFMVENGSLIN